jgi:ABC-type branched-subunit amino acid transport system ATPase component
MKETTPALEVTGLTSGYGESMVINGIDFTIARGEILAILGKNGMGKTTLLRTIMGFLRAMTGNVRLYGEDITNLAPYKIARHSIAYSPQDQAIFQDLTVDENLRLGIAEGQDYEKELERVSGFFGFLGQRRRQRAGTLSGGEQKMLLVARALLGKPRLMLVDEISEGLQPSVVQKVADVLRAERDRLGFSILLIEQNVHFALEIADRYAILKRGEITETGLRADTASESLISDHLSV